MGVTHAKNAVFPVLRECVSESGVYAAEDSTWIITAMKVDVFIHQHAVKHTHSI